MGKPFPPGEHAVKISLSRYRTWAVGRVVYQAHVGSRDGVYSHFGDDPGIVTEWMDRRDRPREVVSENETREVGHFKISVNADGVIEIVGEIDSRATGETEDGDV